VFRQPGANPMPGGFDPDCDCNCLDLQDGPLGIDVCLTCFNGGCLDAERRHAFNHYKKSGHKFALNVKRRRKPSSGRVRFRHPFPPALLSDTANQGRR